MFLLTHQQAQYLLLISLIQWHDVLKYAWQKLNKMNNMIFKQYVLHTIWRLEKVDNIKSNTKTLHTYQLHYIMYVTPHWNVVCRWICVISKCMYLCLFVTLCSRDNYSECAMTFITYWSTRCALGHKLV